MRLSDTLRYKVIPVSNTLMSMIITFGNAGDVEVLFYSYSVKHV